MDHRWQGALLVVGAAAYRTVMPEPAYAQNERAHAENDQAGISVSEDLAAAKAEIAAQREQLARQAEQLARQEARLRALETRLTEMAAALPPANTGEGSAESRGTHPAGTSARRRPAQGKRPRTHWRGARRLRSSARCRGIGRTGQRDYPQGTADRGIPARLCAFRPQSRAVSRHRGGGIGAGRGVRYQRKPPGCRHRLGGAALWLQQPVRTGRESPVRAPVGYVDHRTDPGQHAERSGGDHRQQRQGQRHRRHRSDRPLPADPPEPEQAVPGRQSPGHRPDRPGPVRHPARRPRPPDQGGDRRRLRRHRPQHHRHRPVGPAGAVRIGGLQFQSRQEGRYPHPAGEGGVGRSGRIRSRSPAASALPSTTGRASISAMPTTGRSAPGPARG